MMEAWLNFLKEILTNHALLQVFVGGGTLLLLAYMVLMGFRHREKLPPAALGSVADLPAPSFQGPAALLDIQREIRDYTRRMSEEMARMAECLREIKNQNVKQTGLLEDIEREQDVQNRAHERERDRDHR